MVQGLMEAAYYSDITRYTGNAFLRARLGAMLEEAAVPAKIFETRQDAEAGLGLS